MDLTQLNEDIERIKQADIIVARDCLCSYTKIYVKTINGYITNDGNNESIRMSNETITFDDVVLQIHNLDYKLYKLDLYC